MIFFFSALIYTLHLKSEPQLKFNCWCNFHPSPVGCSVQAKKKPLSPSERLMRSFKKNTKTCGQETKVLPVKFPAPLNRSYPAAAVAQRWLSHVAAVDFGPLKDVLLAHNV